MELLNCNRLFRSKTFRCSGMFHSLLGTLAMIQNKTVFHKRLVSQTEMLLGQQQKASPCYVLVEKAQFLASHCGGI